MKRIILLCLMLICTASIFAQNSEPSQIPFSYKGLNQQWDANNPEFKQNRFILGWHWGDGKRMSEALGCTQGHQRTKKPRKYVLSRIFF